MPYGRRGNRDPAVVAIACTGFRFFRATAAFTRRGHMNAPLLQQCEWGPLPGGWHARTQVASWRAPSVGGEARTSCSLGTCDGVPSKFSTKKIEKGLRRFRGPLKCHTRHKAGCVAAASRCRAAPNYFRPRASVHRNRLFPQEDTHNVCCCCSSLHCRRSARGQSRCAQSRIAAAIRGGGQAARGGGQAASLGGCCGGDCGSAVGTFGDQVLACGRRRPAGMGAAAATC